MALLLTSSSLARSLIRTLLIRPFLSPCGFRSLLPSRSHCPASARRRQSAGARLVPLPPRLRRGLPHPRIPQGPPPPRSPGLTLRRPTLQSPPFPQQAALPRQSPDWQNNYSPLD